MRIALVGPVAVAQRERLAALLRVPADFRESADERSPAAIAAAVADADVAVARVWPSGLDAPRLRLLQVHAAGLDAVDLGSVPAAATVCNAMGHEPAVAEFVVHGLLRTFRHFAQLEADFRRTPALLDTRSGLAHADELSSKTIGILGLGGIGIETARRLSAFGCRLVGCNRTVRNPDGLLARCLPLDELDRFCRGLDALVVACALVPQTSGLIRMRHYWAMNYGAVLVNVARGEIVDYTDLHDALSRRRLGGAVLDVWHDDRSLVRPLIELPGVTATPHVSGWTREMLARRWREVADNIGRLHRGERLERVVRAAA